MSKVYVFHFERAVRSFNELRNFIDKTYDADDNSIDSPFIKEVGLTDYEPACIEAIVGNAIEPLADLLAGASYAEQWLAWIPIHLRPMQRFVCTHPMK